MENKQQIVTSLSEIFNRWQELLTSLSAEQVMEPLVPSDWTVKDVVAHLWSWQQASVARAEAALNGRAPEYPKWWEACGPDPEEDVDRTNAYLYKASRDKPWKKIYADWKSQFQHYLKLSSHIPEKDLLEPGRYAWMGSYALSASPLGSLNHHGEHFDTLSAWLREHGKTKTVR